MNKKKLTNYKELNELLEKEAKEMVQQHPDMEMSEAIQSTAESLIEELEELL